MPRKIIIPGLLAVVLCAVILLAMYCIRTAEAPVAVRRDSTLDPVGAPAPALAAAIDDPRLTEISGIAASAVDTGLFWVHNDSGHPAELFGITLGGRVAHTVALADAFNRDWEDLTRYTWQGRPALVIADTGDNLRDRETLDLYLVCEEDLPEAGPVQRFTFRLAGGPRDCETLAADPETGTLYLVEKGYEAWAGLFRLPPLAAWTPAGAAPIVAERIGELPIPAVTGGDIAPDNRHAVFISYTGLYVYTREQGETWPRALAGTPLRVGIGAWDQYEAVCFGSDSATVYFTRENRDGPGGAPLPLYRVVLPANVE